MDKRIGETPLEALERFRSEQVAVGRVDLVDVPMTYAGRLDPMAEGKLIILIGDECKDKDKYLGLYKEYEVEVLFGVETDTYDILGLAKNIGIEVAPRFIEVRRYVGTFQQQYPPYSSKTIDGVQLHTLARAGDLPDDMPTKEVTIYSIEELDRRKIGSIELKKDILKKIVTVKGDFRQKEIIARWDEILNDPDQQFDILKIRVACSSGTYMRSLAHRMGLDRGDGACALSIKRTKIVY